MIRITKKPLLRFAPYRKRSIYHGRPMSMIGITPVTNFATRSKMNRFMRVNVKTPIGFM